MSFSWKVQVIDIVSKIEKGELKPEKPAETEQKTPPVKEPAEDSGLTKAERLAYQSYEYAINTKEAELSEATDRQIHQWLKENGCSDPDYCLPSFETWSRYVRQGRWVHATQKNTLRKGRTGRSIAKVDQIKFTSSQRSDEAD